MKRVAVLGCSGSIGKTALQVLKNLKDDFKVVLLANNTNEYELFSQANVFSPEVIYCNKGIQQRNGTDCNFDPFFLSRPETFEDIDLVLNGIVGLAGLEPTLAAIDAGKILATANKESLVCGGELINRRLYNSRSVIRPVDSEHSTVWQCLEDKNNVKRIILTASGGAFRHFSKERIALAKAEDALKHPNWIMGKKVTIDCATLVNKGMEIIEAKRLFGIENVDAIQHDESVVHSFVEMKDGTMIAGLSTPDMTIPIQYALTYPERLANNIDFLDLVKRQALRFGILDEEKFPCFALCKRVSEFGDYAGTVMNAADEIAVDAYLKGEIGFYGIYNCIESALHYFGFEGIIKEKEDIFRIDREVREYCLKYIGDGKC